MAQGSKRLMSANWDGRLRFKTSRQQDPTMKGSLDHKSNTSEVLTKTLVKKMKIVHISKKLPIPIGT